MSEVLLRIYKSVSETPSGGSFNLKKSDECRETINQPKIKIIKELCIHTSNLSEGKLFGPETKVMGLWVQPVHLPCYVLVPVMGGE